MVFGQFSDFLGTDWFANIRKMAKDHKDYGSQISESWPRTIRATVPQLRFIENAIILNII